MSPLSPPSLRTALSRLPRDPVVPYENERIPAAVAIILREPEPVDLLLIKRAESPRDPWSGHMALPGGRLDPGDDHLLATAVRETHEETGLLLGDSATFLGRLPLLAPKAVRLPPIAVWPHVFMAPGEASARVASHEVESVHWVSLEELRDPASRGEFELHLAEGSRVFPCFNVDGQTVWGMTYRILEDFLGLLRRD